MNVRAKSAGGGGVAFKWDGTPERAAEIVAAFGDQAQAPILLMLSQGPYNPARRVDVGMVVVYDGAKATAMTEAAFRERYEEAA